MDQSSAWAVVYNAEPDKVKALEAILDSMFSSFELLIDFAKQPHPVQIQKRAALISMLGYLDKEWREFVQKTHAGIRPDGFASLIQNRYPDIYAFWMQMRGKIGMPRL